MDAFQKAMSWRISAGLSQMLKGKTRFSCTQIMKKQLYCYDTVTNIKLKKPMTEHQ